MNAATEDDIRSGKAIFYVQDGRSTPYDLGRQLPAAASAKIDMQIGDGKIIPAGTAITIVQAELADTGNVLIGFRYDGGEGLCSLEEIELAN